ncbi:addiction module antitoxin, RelB/DinJ family [Moraxella caviae]|uniref:Addiction module antitoxin, RelB/DinJ family n=2 Tax=Moraxella caviae TaxID=34060 RepID=A0A378R7N8_9GAMM|nr:addiction module antitoxin, RelB/DinJ family [Moraxella caviae]
MHFDPVVKQQFAQLTANYGLTVAQAFKLFANQSIKTGVLPLSFDWQKPIENNELSIDNLNSKCQILK